MKERWKEVTTKSREKRDQGKYGGELGIMEYVPRIVEVRYWQQYRLAPPLKCLGPPLASQLKKAGAATGLQKATVIQ